MVKEKEPSTIIYPYAEELTEQFLEYYQDSLKKCRDGYYKCVVLEKNNYYRKEMEDALSSKYEKIDDYVLRCGQENWECSVYTIKN